MPDETDTDDGEPQMELPEMDSYTLTVTRQFEVDLTEDQAVGMMHQTGADTPEEGIEQAFMQRELGNVEPEQKLLGVNVNAEAPDDEAN